MLFDELRVIKPLPLDIATTYLAVHTLTGRNYLLHWLPPENSPEGTRIRHVLETLSPDARKLIFEDGQRDGRAYLITENPTAYKGLEIWLTAVQEFLRGSPFDKAAKWKIPTEPALARSDPPPPPSEEATRLFAMPGPTTRESGEFTRMFASPSVPPATPAEPTAPPIKEPGEFTRMFAAQAPANPPPPAAPAPTPRREPGEFTRMFAAPEPPPAPSTPAPPPPSSATPPGEFTRMFAAPAPPSPPNPQSPVSAKPGEFTDLFKSPLAHPVPSHSPVLPAADPFRTALPRAPEESEFTRMFGTSSAPRSQPAAPINQENATRIFADPGVQKPVSPAPPQQHGPSDYTRMFANPMGSQSAPSPPQPEAPKSPPAAPAKTPPRNFVLIALLSFLAVCVILIVVYAILKMR